MFFFWPFISALFGTIWISSPLTMSCTFWQTLHNCNFYKSGRGCWAAQRKLWSLDFSWHRDKKEKCIYLKSFFNISWFNKTINNLITIWYNYMTIRQIFFLLIYSTDNEKKKQFFSLFYFLFFLDHWQLAIVVLKSRNQWLIGQKNYLSIMNQSPHLLKNLLHLLK